jgi:hypothetical protein
MIIFQNLQRICHKNFLHLFVVEIAECGISGKNGPEIKRNVLQCKVEINMDR